MSTDSNHSDQLERYLSGAMSPEEAHAFERAVLDDPFLAEALEGYEEHRPREITDDLARLRGKLKKGEQKNSWGWMKIAAAAALLIAAGLSVWFLAADQATQPEELALQEQPEAAATPSNENTAELEKEPPAEIQDKSTTETQRSNGPEIVAEAAPDKRPASTAKEQPPQFAEVPEEATKRIEVENRAQSVPSEPASRTAARMSKKSAAAEPSAMEIASVANEEEMEVDLDVEVVEETEIEDVTMTSAFSGTTYAITKNKPVPAVGWEAYKRYLKDSLKYPAAAKSMGIEGRVLVQAKFLRTGKLDTAYVLKGIGAGCDEEAIRLIIDGPNFQSDSSSAGRIIIPVEFRIN